MGTPAMMRPSCRRTTFNSDLASYKQLPLFSLVPIAASNRSGLGAKATGLAALVTFSATMSGESKDPTHSGLVLALAVTINKKKNTHTHKKKKKNDLTHLAAVASRPRSRSAADAQLDLERHFETALRVSPPCFAPASCPWQRLCRPATTSGTCFSTRRRSVGALWWQRP